MLGLRRQSVERSALRREPLAAFGHQLTDRRPQRPPHHLSLCAAEAGRSPRGDSPAQLGVPAFVAANRLHRRPYLRVLRARGADQGERGAVGLADAALDRVLARHVEERAHRQVAVSQAARARPRSGHPPAAASLEPGATPSLGPRGAPSSQEIAFVGVRRGVGAKIILGQRAPVVARATNRRQRRRVMHRSTQRVTEGILRRLHGVGGSPT